MKKKTKIVRASDDLKIREPEDMYALLNYNILKLLNKTHRDGILDMPVLYCETRILPDYLALYSQKCLYEKTSLTAVCFYEYDEEFTGENGLYEAICHNNTERLNYFKDRFQNVEFVISPDYSAFDDINKIVSLDRLLMARIVSLWFTLEMGKTVIPNISYIGEDWFPICFNGLTECKTVAFNSKGHIMYPSEKKLFIKAINYAVDNIRNLENIVVYSACADDSTCLECFKYALDKGINVVIPNNTLRESNMKRGMQNVRR